MQFNELASFEPRAVENPVKIQLLIDMSELSYVMDSMMLAREFLHTKHIGCRHQTGRAFMVFMEAFHRYLKISRSN